MTDLETINLLVCPLNEWNIFICVIWYLNVANYKKGTDILNFKNTLSSYAFQIYTYCPNLKFWI